MGTPQGISLNETMHAFAFLVSEDSDGAGFLSRDEVVIAAGQNFGVGQVLSYVAVPSQVTEVAAAGTNTGNGIIAMANPGVDVNAKFGPYSIVFTDATHFMVESPDNLLVDEGVVGAAFAHEVLFTITAGGTAFVAGDTFNIYVDVQSESAEQFVAWTGSSRAVAIALYPANTTNGTPSKIAVVNAHAVVRLADLTFSPSATLAQIDEAKFELGRGLIKFR
jgi:hypothetical protein